MSKMTKWFSREWWAYLTERPFTWRKFWCRTKVHSCGPVYYTSDPNANEPDWTCKNCGDYLG